MSRNNNQKLELNCPECEPIKIVKPLGLSNEFDSFDVVMRLAELTGMNEEFDEYSETHKIEHSKLALQ